MAGAPGRAMGAAASGRGPGRTPRLLCVDERLHLYAFRVSLWVFHERYEVLIAYERAVTAVFFGALCDALATCWANDVHCVASLASLSNVNRSYATGKSGKHYASVCVHDWGSFFNETHTGFVGDSL